MHSPLFLSVLLLLLSAPKLSSLALGLSSLLSLMVHWVLLLLNLSLACQPPIARVMQFNTKVGRSINLIKKAY